MDKKKVTILGLHLSYGGVEQAIVNLANCLCDDFDVELVIFYRIHNKEVYDINKKVKIIYLTDLKPNREEFKQFINNKMFVSAFKEGLKSLKILHLRKSLVKDYIQKSNSDIIVSSRILFTKLLSKYAKSNVVTVAQEHCHHNNNIEYINSVKDSCSGIDYLMPVSKSLTDFYSTQINNGRTKCVYIPHCIDYMPNDCSSLDTKNIISVGRLSDEKGYSDLIDVFREISNRRPDWVLNIIGDGDEYNDIKQKIDNYGLSNKIILHGFQSKEYIRDMLEKSSIYLMGSKTESFGIVLIEAMSYGVPCIAFSSAQGALEIIDNGINGYLIEDRDCNAMCDKTVKLIDDINLRKSLGKNARNSSKFYEFENIKNKNIEFYKGILLND